MLYGLESGLQRRFERHGSYEMFQELKLIFQANARVERYEVSKKFYSCKMEENSSVSEHILRMSGYYQCQNRRISGRGSRTVCLRLMVTGGGGHNVYPGSGPLDGGNTLLPA